MAGPVRRMTTGTERGGVRMTLHGLPGPNPRLTPFHPSSYTKIAIGFRILQGIGICHPLALDLHNHERPNVTLGGITPK